MNLHKCILTNNRCYQAGKTIAPKGVMVHSTGCNNPNIKRYVQPDDGILGDNAYNNDWNNSNVTVCVHAFIGKTKDGSIATYQTLPWNRRGWHAGGAANDTHISFEICEDDLTDAVYFGNVYREAVELTAMLCKEYSLDPLSDGVVIGHYEGYKRGIASGHSDPSNWFPKFGKSMDTFRKDVDYFMKHENHAGEDEKVERYKTIDDVPNWAKKETQELIDLGALRGNENGLDVTADMLRTMIINYRAAKMLIGK